MPIPVWIMLTVLAFMGDFFTIWFISDHAYEKGRMKGRSDWSDAMRFMSAKVRSLSTELSIERRQNRELREKYRSLRAKYQKCRMGGEVMKHTRQARQIAVLAEEALGVEQELATLEYAHDENKSISEQRQVYLLGLYQSIGIKVVEVRRMKNAKAYAERIFG